jgi:hypothetical protein
LPGRSGIEPRSVTSNGSKVRQVRVVRLLVEDVHRRPEAREHVDELGMFCRAISRLHAMQEAVRGVIEGPAEGPARAP